MLRQLNLGQDEIYAGRSKMLYAVSLWMPKRGLKMINGLLLIKKKHCCLKDDGFEGDGGEQIEQCKYWTEER
ncbi:MAG TPA: hypothetical protein VF941_07705 [Clostridia bacterium]